MKVLVYVNTYTGMNHQAGSEITLHDLMKALVEKGHRVTVTQGSDQWATVEEDYFIDGVEVRRYRDVTDINRYIESADVIVLQHATVDRGVAIARKAGVPIIQVCHNELGWTAGYLSAGVDLAVYNSDHVRETMESDIGPLVSIPVGAGQAEMRWRVCWDWDGIVVHPSVDPKAYRTATNRRYITLVSLFEDKGVRVFHELARRHPELEFLGVKGAYGDQETEGLPNVTYMEHTNDMLSVYSQTGIILMPSSRESFGRVAVEAAASSIPTVCSSTPGLKEALGYSGYYADTIEQYDEALKSLSFAPLYWSYAKSVQKRSDQLWAQSQVELENFTEKVAQMMEVR